MQNVGFNMDKLLKLVLSGGAFVVLWLALIIVGIIGYIKNIVIVLGIDPVATTEYVIRIVGVIVPFIGAIMGYL
jgi:hypothetical protein